MQVLIVALPTSSGASLVDFCLVTVVLPNTLQLFLTFRKKLVTVWNLKGEKVTSCVDSHAPCFV